ncbi:GNAT family N-acetyltransferase [Candidatus Bathyarchaeota archaeon]|nr:GNAT family N-acetyltransferase [Candidatus Bathyarchaeota archaeon]
MNPVTVRLATTKDCESLLKMPPYSNCKFDCLLCSEDVLVAEKNGVVIGAVSISYKDISYVPGERKPEFNGCLNDRVSQVSGVWISKLYILPEYRSQGVATKVTKEAIEYIKKNSFTEAYAGVNTKNMFRKISEHVFEKNGFKKIGSCICFLTQNGQNCAGTLLKKTIKPSEKKTKK